MFVLLGGRGILFTSLVTFTKCHFLLRAYIDLLVFTRCHYCHVWLAE